MAREYARCMRPCEERLLEPSETERPVGHDIIAPTGDSCGSLPLGVEREIVLIVRLPAEERGVVRIGPPRIAESDWGSDDGR